MNRIEHFVFTSLFLALICPNNLYAQVASGTLNGHDYVDLGLSVKWATCNVGATKPSDYGNYYAWGETSTKSTYTEENSKTHGNNSYNYDIGRNITTDAARANWSGTWRLPTEAEVRELVDKCAWTWTTHGGHSGYKVTGSNSGSIFLPAAGIGGYGRYWTSTPYGNNALRANYLYFYSSFRLVVWTGRYLGLSIRPVIDK